MMKRIFTAIEISSEAKSKVSEYIRELKTEFSDLRVGWEKPEKIHLTMKFFGDCDEKDLRNIENSLTKAVENFSKFESVSKIKIKIIGNGVFPSKRNARILWLGLENENGKLARLNQLIEEECEKIGFEKENRKFTPHLTIARLREPRNSENLASEHLRRKFEPVEFDVSEIVIYESTLHPTGSIHKKLKSINFSQSQ